MARARPYLIAGLLAVPSLMLLIWHLLNNNLPASDGANYLENTFAYYESFRGAGLYEGLKATYSVRGWRPVLFPVFALPFLLLTGGNLLLSVALTTALILGVLSYFTYRLFRLYLSPLQSVAGSLVISTNPYIFLVSTMFWSEVALVALAIAGFYFLIKSDYFRRAPESFWTGVFFGLILLFLYVVALTAQWITPNDPFAINLRAGFEPPSAEHWFGTDQFGRDMLSRVILATQVTAKVTGAAILFALISGVPIGMFVGYRGGWIESVVMRMTDMLLIFPTIMLAIVVVAVAGASENGVILALGLSQFPQFIRIARGVTLSVKEELYVEASIAAGSGWFHILVHHIWPNIATPIIVQATLTLPIFVLNASALSYLGLGVQPPTPEWGQMLNEAKDFLLPSPYLIVGPAIALFLFVLSANLVGDTFQETLNPKLKKRK